MNLRKAIGAGVAFLSTCVLIGAPAQAQQSKIASFQATSGSPFAFTSNGAGGGTLVTQNLSTVGLGAGTSFATGFASSYVDPGTNSPVSTNFPAYMKFGPLELASVNTTTQTARFVSNNPPGTSFSIWTGENGTGDLLLSGYFEDATMNFSASNSTQQLFNVNFNGVAYNGGSYIDDLPGGAADPLLTGNLTLTFGVTGISTYTTGGGVTGLNNFTAGSLDGSFFATPDDSDVIGAVPEPGEYAVMGMAGLTLCGLMVRARRRKSAAA